MSCSRGPRGGASRRRGARGAGRGAFTLSLDMRFATMAIVRATAWRVNYFVSTYQVCPNTEPRAPRLAPSAGAQRPYVHTFVDLFLNPDQVARHG